MILTAFDFNSMSFNYIYNSIRSKTSVTYRRKKILVLSNNKFPQDTVIVYKKVNEGYIE